LRKAKLPLAIAIAAEICAPEQRGRGFNFAQSGFGLANAGFGSGGSCKLLQLGNSGGIHSRRSDRTHHGFPFARPMSTRTDVFERKADR
jgi:hypothetical protein